MQIIGLSGGIASGKNEVAKIFENFGVPVFDADFLVHDFYENNPKIIAQIQENFSIFQGKNFIDRKLLSEIISNEPAKIKVLEQIIHPEIKNKFDEFVKINQQKNSPLILLNIPLLLEKNHYQTDKIIAVITDKNIRLNRYLSRFATQDDIDKKIQKFEFFNNLQLTDEQRLKNCDFVIYNNSDVEALKLQVQELFSKLNLAKNE